MNNETKIERFVIRMTKSQYSEIDILAALWNCSRAEAARRAISDSVQQAKKRYDTNPDLLRRG
jgi:hypothetical protein